MIKEKKILKLMCIISDLLVLDSEFNNNSETEYSEVCKDCCVELTALLEQLEVN